MVHRPRVGRISRLVKRRAHVFLCKFNDSKLTTRRFRLQLLQLNVSTRTVARLRRVMLGRTHVAGTYLIVNVDLDNTAHRLVSTLSQTGTHKTTIVCLASSGTRQRGQACRRVILTPMGGGLRCKGIVSPRFPVLLVLSLVCTRLLGRSQHDARTRCSARV